MAAPRSLEGRVIEGILAPLDEDVRVAHLFPSGSARRRLAEQLEHYRPMNVDPVKLPLGDSSFDVVIASDAPRLEDAAIREIWRVLRPEGVAILPADDRYATVFRAVTPYTAATFRGENLSSDAALMVCEV